MMVLLPVETIVCCSAGWLAFFFFFPLSPSLLFLRRKEKKKKKKKETCNEIQSGGLTIARQASVDWKDRRGPSSTIWHTILLLLLLLVQNFGVNQQTSKTLWETPIMKWQLLICQFTHFPFLPPQYSFKTSSPSQFLCLPVKICTALSGSQMAPFTFLLGLLLRMNEGQS